MIDREKVIKGLGIVSRMLNEMGRRNEMDIVDDALALLKEREAVEPKQVDLYGNDEWWGLVCVCPDCKAEWMSDKADTHFCPKCGRSVIWNDL